MKIWKDEEVKSLFKVVEQCKKSGEALRQAFVTHAQNFKRQPNSVRNYYYHEVDNLAQDESRRKRLKINLLGHEKTHFVEFDKAQENELFERIEKLVASGKSVRSACLQLSNGNLTAMTRLQNKFQNMKRKLGANKSESANNIIPFKNAQKALTDADINSLFLGLVKLIKKTALDEARQTASAPNELLRKAFLDLGKKDREMKSLKAEFEHLKAENQALRLKVEQDKKTALQQHIIAKRQKAEIAEKLDKQKSKRI